MTLILAPSKVRVCTKMCHFLNDGTNQLGMCFEDRERNMSQSVALEPEYMAAINGRSALLTENWQ